MRFIWVTVLCKQMGRNTKWWLPIVLNSNNLNWLSLEERKQSQLSEAFCLPSRKSFAIPATLRKELKFEQHWFTLFICIPTESPTTSTKLQRLRDEIPARMWGERERKTLSSVWRPSLGMQASGIWLSCLTPRLRLQDCLINSDNTARRCCRKYVNLRSRLPLPQVSFEPTNGNNFHPWASFAYLISGGTGYVTLGYISATGCLQKHSCDLPTGSFPGLLLLDTDQSQANKEPQCSPSLLPATLFYFPLSFFFLSSNVSIFAGSHESHLLFIPNFNSNFHINSVNKCYKSQTIFKSQWVL